QVLQMIIVFVSLFLVGYIAVGMLPDGVGFKQAIQEATTLGKMNVITTGFKSDGSFDWKDKYNIWSGIIGGFFLALSYFGTDHSQVGRYLTAKNTSESKKGLLMNGLVKVPMQFFILLIGVLIFMYYQYSKPPVFFDQKRMELANATPYAPQLKTIEAAYYDAFNNNKAQAAQYREEYKKVLQQALPAYDVNDNNYIFLYFVKDKLPVGLIGLLFAVIFLAAWGSIAAALNSLAACTMVDFHKKFTLRKTTEHQDFKISQWYTFFWGLFCIGVAMFAHNIGNSLIETVNILGSIFYGVILGVFLVAFWIRFIKGHAVFIAAAIAQVLVVVIYMLDVISFLWLNVIGAILVIAIGCIIQWLQNQTIPKVVKS
ncbi:MAG TPA: sodium:solute symporter, partial [Ferruginibacter sp.]|nr:sodium:solute symporter [Ferruginibacter sp.]